MVKRTAQPRATPACPGRDGGEKGRESGRRPPPPPGGEAGCRCEGVIAALQAREREHPSAASGERCKSSRRGQQEHPLTLRPLKPLTPWRAAAGATTAPWLFPAGAVREAAPRRCSTGSPLARSPAWAPGRGSHRARPAAPLTSRAAPHAPTAAASRPGVRRWRFLERFSCELLNSPAPSFWKDAPFPDSQDCITTAGSSAVSGTGGEDAHPHLTQEAGGGQGCCCPPKPRS